MDQIKNGPAGTLAKELFRSIVFVTILIHGATLIILSQVSSPDYIALANFELFNFICFLLVVSTYLTATRMQSWKVLIPFTSLVTGFVIELLNRVYF